MRSASNKAKLASKLRRLSPRWLAIAPMAASPRRPFRIFRRAGTVFSTHSDIDDRARALRLETKVLAGGNVQVGHIVIKS
jgi:Zn-dependent protease with chaperone function